MTAAALLARLTGVRQTAPDRWKAQCPAHEDRTPSLAVRELPDGRVLVHDFGGCAAGDVLASIGLALADLFPDGPLPPQVQTRPAYLPTRHRIPPTDLLVLIQDEVLTVGIIAAQFLEQHAITEDEWRRLALAISRIGAVADHVRESRR